VVARWNSLKLSPEAKSSSHAVEANRGDPAACLSVSQANQVAPGTSTCGPNGENGVYRTTSGAVINGTRGPLGENFTKEGINLEFRAEAFNTFNHAQFGQPDGNVNDNTFGIINTANSPRIMQVSLKLLF
jgi:hypothetical protein